MTIPMVFISGMNLSPRMWHSCSLPSDAIILTPEANSIEDNIEMFLQVLPEKFYLGGLSLGANLAMRIASETDRVAGLMLLATNAKGPTSKQLSNWRTTRQEVKDGTSPESVQEGLLHLLLSDVGQQDPNMVNQALKSAADLKPKVLENQLLTQATRADQRSELRKIGAPTIVIAGGEDAMCPVSNHEEIASLIPNAQLVMAENSGHLIPIESPETVNHAITQLIQN